MNEEKELLRKQMKLLAKQSECETGYDLSRITSDMCGINRELIRNRLAVLLAVLAVIGLNSQVCILVYIQKTLGRDS